MTTAKLRQLMKTLDPKNTVSLAFGNEGWKVATKYDYTKSLALFEKHGLRVVSHDFTGPRWDHTHNFYVTKNETK